MHFPHSAQPAILQVVAANPPLVKHLPACLTCANSRRLGNTSWQLDSRSNPPRSLGIATLTRRSPLSLQHSPVLVSPQQVLHGNPLLLHLTDIPRQNYTPLEQRYRSQSNTSFSSIITKLEEATVHFVILLYDVIFACMYCYCIIIYHN